MVSLSHTRNRKPMLRTTQVPGRAEKVIVLRWYLPEDVVVEIEVLSHPD